MSKGLVLEGGAMRGMFTAGVLDTFLDENIGFDKIVGVSAGALFGVNFLSEQKGRAVRYCKRFNSDKEYMGIRPLLREGNLLNTEYVYERVPRRLDKFDNDIYMKNEANCPFYATVTRIDTGEAEYIEVKDVFEQMDTLRASGSMPFFAVPVKIGEHEYLDGAVADSIPFEWMMDQGCEKVIVVLTRDMDYRKKPVPKLPVKFKYRKYPEFSASFLSRHEMYNREVERLTELEAEGKIYVIRPSVPIEIGRVEKDPEKLQQVYELGIADTLKQIDAIKEYLVN